MPDTKKKQEKEFAEQRKTKKEPERTEKSTDLVARPPHFHQKIRLYYWSLIVLGVTVSIYQPIKNSQVVTPVVTPVLARLGAT